MSKNTCLILLIVLATIACSTSVLNFSYGQSEAIRSQLGNKSQIEINVLPALEYQYSGFLMPEDANRLAEIRQAGLSGNRSQIPAMITVLQNPSHRVFAFATLRALSRLGATDALPVFEAYLPQTIMQPHGDFNLSNFARVTRARLLAESASSDIADSRAQAAAKVNRFYTELGLTSNDLNNCLKAYNTPQVDANGMVIYSTGPRNTPCEVYAIGELADMVYHGSYKDFVSLPGIAQVNFQQD